MAKIVKFNTDARNEIKKGVDILANAVRVTLGPKGRNVIINKKYKSPQITKDGVTVAKQILLSDPVQNIGAQIVKEVASKTADIAGDGTTTATVLAQDIFNSGIKYITAGANPIDLKRGIDIAVNCVVKNLKAQSKPINRNTIVQKAEVLFKEKVNNDDNDISYNEKQAIIKEIIEKDEIAQVGSISANNEEDFGVIISYAMHIAGEEGIITLEEGKSIDTTVKLVEGMQINRGYISPHFINDLEKAEIVLEDAYVLLYDKKIATMKDVLPILEQVSKTGKPILIIADNVEGEALATLLLNKVRGMLKVVAVRAPSVLQRRIDMLEDIATLTGGTAIIDEQGQTLEGMRFTDLGVANYIKVTRQNTTIVSKHSDPEKLQERISTIRTMIANTKSDWDREKLQERLGKLTNGVAVISVGAVSEIEMKEKKDRFEDSLHATRAAVAEGIVPGGGVSYIRTIEKLDELIVENEDQKLGVEIIKKAIESPLRQIVENSGMDSSVIIRDVRFGSGDFGYNARTERYENLFTTGVIDPTKVVRVAIENAASIAGMLLTTECVIIDEIVEDKESPDHD